MSKLHNVPAALAAAAAPSKSAEPVLRVVMYRRGATDEGTKQYSLDAQAQLLRPYITNHPDWVEAGDYVERATAKDVKGRPQLQQLLRDAAAGKFDLVLVAGVDRWSRNLADLLKTVAFLGEHNVAFHSATEPFDTTNPMCKKSLQILGMFAELESGLIIDRIARVNASKISGTCR
jgi:site-specific DNA recombinase